METLKSLAWLGFLTSLTLNVESWLNVPLSSAWAFALYILLMFLIFAVCQIKGRSKLLWSDCTGTAKLLLYLALPYLLFTFGNEFRPQVQGDTFMRVGSAFLMYSFLFTAGALNRSNRL